MPVPRFRIRTLMIAVAVVGITGVGPDGLRAEMPPRVAQGQPETPRWVVAAATVFGLAFFISHSALAVQGFWRSATREDRLDAAGAVIPGLAGLGIVGAAWVGPPWAFALIAAGILLMTVGRAVYELIVFRPRPPCDSPGSRPGG